MRAIPVTARLGRRLAAVALLVVTVGACHNRAEAPDAAAPAGCEVIAEQTAELIVDAAERHAEDFAATVQAGADPTPAEVLPADEVTESEGDPWSLAAAKASPDDAVTRERAAELRQAAEAQQCGPPGWANATVAQRLQRAAERRMQGLAGQEASTEDYFVLNVIAILQLHLTDEPTDQHSS